MRTFLEHVTNRVVDACSGGVNSDTPPSSPSSTVNSPINRRNSRLGEATVLITGGGAHNVYLMHELRAKLRQKGLAVQETDNCTVDFKEALIFAYLGLRCLLGLRNVFSDTTGARSDSVSGSIHQPPAVEGVKTNLHSHFRFLLRRSLSISSS